MRGAIAEQLNVRRRYERRSAEPVLELRSIWQQRQPKEPCQFGIWTRQIQIWKVPYIEFIWRDLAPDDDTPNSGRIALSPSQNFEYIAVAAALLDEISALRSATLKKPATKEDGYGIGQKSVA